MKTKRISKLLGWGLSIAVVLSLGLAALPVGAQGEMEWAEVTTPSWEDEVIAPGSDIFDYAIGNDDGSIVFALGAVVGGHSATSVPDALANACGNPDMDYSGKAIGLTGDFDISSGTIDITEVSDDVAEVEGDLSGTPCYLYGDFTWITSVWIDITGDGFTGDDFSGEAAVSGEITDDSMTFSGRLYRDTGNLTATALVGAIDGTYFAESADLLCVNEWVVDTLAFGADDDLFELNLSEEGWFTEPRAWSSDDGGVTWTDITATVQEASNLPGPYVQFMYGGVDVASDDEDWLVVAGGIYLPPCDYDYTACKVGGCWFGDYPDYNGAPAVVASQDGAGEFTYAGDMTDSANGTTMARIYDIAVAPEMDDIHNIAVAGITLDGACFSGNSAGAVFRLEAGTWLSGNWEDTSFYDGWDSGVDPTGDPSAVVTVVDFSPNFDLDVTILFMSIAVNSTSDPIPYLQSGIWESGGTWNDEADFAPAVQIKDDGAELWAYALLRMMGFALPADYDGSDPGARNIYLYVDAYNTVTETSGGTVVMVEDDSLSPRCGPSGNPMLASIDVHGDADSCKAMVGRYIDWENVSGSDVGDPIPWDCCEGVPVWHTVELDYCCPDWDGACKDPSGPYTALVAYTPDGEKAFAATSGTLEFSGDPFNDFSAGLCDESAFSVSLDDGNSFNQLSLIDTDIDFISDVAVCPDCETVYISTINFMQQWGNCCNDQSLSVYQTASCDSVWRSWTKDGGDIGDAWERVYHGDWTEYTTTGNLILRLPVDDLEDCCTLYMGIQGTNDLHYTRDCGQCWNTPPDTKITIQDIAVETENVVYVLDSDGYVSKSTQYGRRPSDEVDTDAGSGHTIFVMPDDMVIIGGTDGDSVAWSDDGGETWTVMDDIEAGTDGTIHVIFDHICDDIVYAAINDDNPSNDVGGIYRGYMSDGSWEDLQAMPYDYTGIVLGRSDGTLYASSDNITIDTSETLCDRFVSPNPPLPSHERYSGAARNLTPCETDCCGTEDWDYLISGLSPDPNEYFDSEPSALRICGCTTMATPSILWAIDWNHYDVSDASDGTLWAYEDCASKYGPTLLSPADEAVLDCDPCLSCEGIPFTLKWERMCIGCSWDIEIMDEDGNLITMTTELEDVDITTDPPEFYLDDSAIQCGRTYTWHVRLANTETDECVHSPWSDTWSFTIAASAADAVSLIAPENGDMGIQISSVPFSWSSVSNADSYSFVLSPNSDLSGALASEELSGTAYEYTGSLSYLTPYYWQVTAWKDGTALSQSVIGAFTTIAEAVPVPEPPEPAPAPVVNIPATQMITPTWIYAIIGIGAALAVVVIVLIVRTRRP